MAFVIEGDLSDGWAQRANAEFPESVYETKFTAVEAREKDGKKTARATFEVQGGQYKGAKIVKSFGLDLSKRGNQAQMVSLLVACGTPEEKAKTAKKFDLEKLFGKTVHLYVRPKEPGEEYGDRNIVHPDDVADLVKLYGKNGEQKNGAAHAGEKSSGASSGDATPQPEAADELDLG